MISRLKKKKPEWIQIPSKVSNQPEYANLTTDSIHQTIPPPVNRRNGNGVWVMGASKPVKVFDWEYREYNPIKIIRKTPSDTFKGGKIVRKRNGLKMVRKKVKK